MTEKDKYNVSNISEEKPTANAPLQKGLDYYIENGRYVFTEYYLLRRSYCCGSGCRHCPYQGTIKN